MLNCNSGLLNKNEKLLKGFWLKDLDTQKELSVIELHTQLNPNYNELKIKKSFEHRLHKLNEDAFRSVLVFKCNKLTCSTVYLH